jgi:CheY-like chemotaxis protein
MKILAVDDDPFILELLPQIASAAGFPDVSKANSATEALDLIFGCESVFDCLLLDIRMPGMDGIELCARVRNMPQYRSTPIIMLTAVTDMGHLDRAFRAGATDYTTKPFDVIDFGARLEVAAKMAMSLQQASSDAADEPEQAGNPTASHSFLLSEAMAIPGANALITFTSLRNYLNRISGTEVGRVSVVALSIDRITTLYTSLPTPDFRRVLARTAAAIDAMLEPEAYLMAYAGHGYLVLVGCDMNHPPQKVLEADVRATWHDMARHHIADRTLNIRLTVSPPLRPGSNRTRRAEIAFANAIQLAGARESSNPGFARKQLFSHGRK